MHLNQPLFRRRSNKQGSALFWVIAMMFIMMTAIVALHHQQTVSKSALMRAEAELRFREGRRFALRERWLGTSQPWGLEVGADVEDVTPESSHSIDQNYAQKLFQRADGKWSGLPDLRKADGAHAHRYLELKPDPSGAFRGSRSGSYKMVETEIPGYAAYAPNGEVKLGEVLGWQNPSHEDGGSATDAYSGVPAIVGARGDIEISELAYGEAHSKSGEVEIHHGAGIGFVGNLPLPAYEEELMGELQIANLSLTGSAQSGDKTGLFSNSLGLYDMLSVLFGGSFSPESVLSVKQAFNFPTPMIPGGSVVVPGIVWEVWLHVPFQPDLGFSNQHDPDLTRLNDIAKEQQDAGPLLEAARQQLEEAQAAYEAAQAAYAADPSDSNQEALEEAQEDLQDAQEKFEELKDFMEDSAEEAADIAGGKVGSGMSSLPQTRNEDPQGRNGQWGWNYSQTIGKMFDLVTTVVSGGSTEQIAASISSNVRVVHYGPKDEVPGFEWNGSTFVSRSTWTVPASRTLRYDGSMEIRGDLWLQRGTVMVVNGDLNVLSPVATPSVTDSFKPSGRVFFEEGSTLIVRGNFRCQGSSHFGSILVGGEPGEVHPITSALMVDGSVDIPFGIYSGHTVADLVGEFHEEGANLIQEMLGQRVPLISKLAGPFHLRNSYFARYATTFQLVTIPFPPVVAVTPVPSPKENVLVTAFRALSFTYTGSLNLTVGDNLYTQSDWWPFGNGVVPMALNLDLGAALAAAGEAEALADSADLDPATIETEVRDFIEELQVRAIDWALSEVTAMLYEEAGRMLTPGGFGPIVDAATAIADELKTEEDSVEDFYNDFVQSYETQLATHGRNLLSRLLENTNVLDADQYLRDYAGLLVYGRTITIGDQARQASGMFVAEEDFYSGADLTVGTLMSRNGSIRTGDFLYYPYYNQASLYVPLEVPGDDLIQRASFEAYGAAHDSGTSVQVGPPPATHRLTAGGWDK